MTIEEKVQQNPEEFKALLDMKTETIQAALRALSQSFDIIFNDVIKEYSKKNGVEFDLEAIPTYKTMNKLITGKIDSVVAEYIAGKRKDL